MPITENMMEVRLAERIDGGRMGTTVVQDHVSNNIFPDVGTIALAAGRVWLRKGYAFVNQEGTDILTEGYLCITHPPTNEKSSCAIFTDGSSFSYEPEYKSYLTSYLTDSIQLQGNLMGKQLKDMSTITLYQRLDAPLPEVGKTYAIIANEGEPTQVEQAVKITTVTQVVRTFYDASKDREYTRRIVTLGLKDPLNATYVGSSVQPTEPESPSAIMRETVVSPNAARIYGIAKLAIEANQGDYVLQIDSPFAQIIPASQREIINANVTAANTASTLLPSATGEVSFTTSVSFGPGVPLYFGSPSVPDSVRIVTGGTTLTETGGQLYSGSTVVATVDSASGIVTPVPGSPDYSGLKTVYFTPAGVATAPKQSLSIKITEANRGKRFIQHLPLPRAKNSVELDYHSGDWYTLSEIGDGILKGSDDAWGRAVIDSENTLSIELGAYPDVGTEIIIRFGVSSFTADRSSTTQEAGYFEFYTTAAISPNGLSIEWVGGKVAMDDGHGNLTGDAVGTVVYSTKRIRIRPNVLPPKGTVFYTTITPRTAMTETIALATLINGTEPVTITLQHGPIIPYSVNFTISALESVNPPEYRPDGPYFLLQS